MYEHPQICMPQKEVNFFSRERNWTRGYDWYESVFAECPTNAIVGEFSTSYLTDAATPARIRSRYPDVKLIVSLRHPVDRAYSSYLNDIVAGAVPPGTRFQDALRAHPEYLEKGRYAHHLGRYLDHFPREQLLILLFDDARRDPQSAIGDGVRVSRGRPRISAGDARSPDCGRSSTQVRADRAPAALTSPRP